VPQGVTAVDDLADLAQSPVRGLVFSYELFDALPVHRLVKGDGHAWRELGVALDDDKGFRWQELAADRTDLSELLGEQAAAVESGQIVDLAPGWQPLYRRLAETLECGLLVTCDYGFERHRLLDSRVRRHGTLACYRRQRVHRNPFVDVGSQDLTAHIDFTALVAQGEAAGLETVGLVSQAEWLGACGVFSDLGMADPATRLEAAQLMNLDGMGSEIRVLVQARDIDLEGLFDLELKPPKGC
jgi:SAM-dependent MidA family methyltransferase